MSLARALLLFVSVLLGVQRVAAFDRCGDDVDGRGTAVACACGDLLVSSHRLGAADPVVAAPCPGSALLVDADGAVTLDFAGSTLTGSGQGAGVVVLRGSFALVGPGTITGFETGVLARGGDGLASARNLRVSGNRLDGVFASGAAFTIEGVVAENNGRDGFAIAGRNYALDGNRAARNGRHGFRLVGTGAHVGGGLGNEARDNVGDGFALGGSLHQVVGATAVGNGGDGVSANVGRSLFSAVRADANIGSGLYGVGGGVRIADSEASQNGAFGVWLMGTGAVDGGGNWGTANAGLQARGMTHPPASLAGWMAPFAQCRVGTAPCR